MGSGSSLSKNVSIVVLFVAALVGLIYTIIDIFSDRIEADAVAKPLQAIIKQAKEAWTALTKDEAALKTRSPSGGSAEVLELIVQTIAKLAQEEEKLNVRWDAFWKELKDIVGPQAKDSKTQTLKELIEAAGASLQGMREKAASDIEAVRDSKSALDIEVIRANTQLESLDGKLKSLDVREAEEKTLEGQYRERDIENEKFKRKEADRKDVAEGMAALKKDAGKMDERLNLFHKIGKLAAERYQTREVYDKEYEGLRQEFLKEVPDMVALVDGVNDVSLDLEHEIRRRAILAVNPDAFALTSDLATVESVEKAIAELTAKKERAQKAVDVKRAEEESNTGTEPRIKFGELLSKFKQVRDTYDAYTLKAEEEVKANADLIEAGATERIGKKLLYLRYEETQDGTGFFAVSEVKLSIAELFAADCKQLNLMANSSKHFYTKETLIRVLADSESEILSPGYDPSELKIQGSVNSSRSTVKDKIDQAVEGKHDLMFAAYGARCLVFLLYESNPELIDEQDREVITTPTIGVDGFIGYINYRWAMQLTETYI